MESKPAGPANERDVDAEAELAMRRNRKLIAWLCFGCGESYGVGPVKGQPPEWCTKCGGFSFEPQYELPPEVFGDLDRRVGPKYESKDGAGKKTELG